MAKQLVSDSSSIISLAINCLSTMLKDMDLELVITDEIYHESVARPMQSKRYALESYRIKKLVDEGVVKIENPDPGLTDRIMKVSNSIYRSKKHHIQIIHAGEAAAIALLIERKMDTFLIDERTTRMVIEDPEGLRAILDARDNKKVTINYRKLEEFRALVPKINIIRSSEIAAIAYEKGIIGERLGNNGKEVFMATIHALKFSGCGISWDEIHEYESII